MSHEDSEKELLTGIEYRPLLLLLVKSVDELRVIQSLSMLDYLIRDTF